MTTVVEGGPDGKPNIIYKSQFEVEEVGGIYRAKKVEFEGRRIDLGLVSTVVGTVNIEWLKFNESKLEFPNKEMLVQWPSAYIQFLKLDEKTERERMKNDKDFKNPATLYQFHRRKSADRPFGDGLRG